MDEQIGKISYKFANTKQNEEKYDQIKKIYSRMPNTVAKAAKALEGI